METSAALPAHRRNEDGAHDPVYGTCSTATTRSERRGALGECDKVHDCDSSFLADRGCFHGSEFPGPPVRTRTSECLPR